LKIRFGEPLNGKLSLCLVIAAALLFAGVSAALAAPAPNLPTLPIPAINMAIGAADGPQDVVLTLQIIALITVLSMAPAILLMLTSFTRILVVLGFVRSAMGLQQSPPNQVISSLALFITFFTMAPVWTNIYDNALTPYLQGDVPASVAWDNTVRPMRQFMFKQTREKELSLMLRLAGVEQPNNQDDVETMVLIPAFVLSELKTSFQMGVVIYIPFIVVDMIIASILMSMGMMMLPPSLISMPFKILLFVMADGWNLVIASLVTSFNN
jgi:flagellar biosynthetic protein FliP